jgi:hypothetical protein
MTRIYVIHEHEGWMEPLSAALVERGLAFEDWHLDEGRLDLSAAPPMGVFYNRMSASSHTRGHRFAPEYAGAVLAWLEGHGRRVVNTGRALQLEISKVAQYAALEAEDIRTPRTVAAIGEAEIIKAAGTFDGPFITKHNRAGKGLGVRLFDDAPALEGYVKGADFEAPIDGITLIQEYIEAPEPFITRIEFVGARYLYAVRVDTSEGFELCPADACRVDDQFCPADGADSGLFEILKGFESPLIEPYRRFLIANGIEIAGVEFILDGDGVAYTYDINTNTNYNPEAETLAGVSGMGAIADFLGRELASLEGARAPGSSGAVA